MILVGKELTDYLFLLILTDAASSTNLHRKHFSPRVEIKNYNIETDEKGFYDQPVHDVIRQYDKVRKISTGQGDDYTTGCLLDFAYFKQNYRLIAADLSKQKVLDADSRAILEIIFTGVAGEASIIYYVYEKSKETILQFSKGTTNVLWLHKNGWV